MKPGSATIEMKSVTGSLFHSCMSMNFIYACYIRVRSPIFYNCINILEHNFLLNYVIPACKSGGLVLGEGISKFENKNFGIFYAFLKNLYLCPRAIFLLSY